MSSGKMNGLFENQGMIALVTRYSDIFLAALVVVIVGMMIIPLPTFLIDILLTLNISIAVTLLLVSLYISGAIRIAVFPTLLLITTLFRLALNVSTTRLILLQADAGEVIKAFGRFVVSGNMVVGAVIFLILTLINFIVISKGSERVAEVAARFTLDAMPGKQMSIDADLRSGAFDLDEARRRRRELERESQLFGAMDGAMKFVKGDAVAGIIITCINIVGGVVIGVLMRKMALADALKTYGLLTIGDGLVSQIPALIISTCAGIIVTRVAPETEGDHLGKDIGTQILSYPKAIAITAGLLFLLGTVPGLPLVPFWMLAAASGGLAYALRRNAADGSEIGAADGADGETSYQAEREIEFSCPVPVTITAGTYVSQLISDGTDENGFMQAVIPGIRESIYTRLGVRIPGVRVRGFDPTLPAEAYVISLHDLPVARGRIPEDKIVVLQPAGDLKPLLIPAENTWSPAEESEASLVPVSALEKVEAAGYRVLTGLDILSRHLERILMENAADFLGIQEVRWLCEEWERYFPDLVKEVVPAVVSYQRLTDILRRLAREQVSIRNLRVILEALAEFAPVEQDNLMLTELVRMRLNRWFSTAYTAATGTVEAYLLHPDIEDAFRNAVQKTMAGRYLAMAPDLLERIVAVFENAFRMSNGAPKIVLVMDPEIRFVLWRFLRQQYSRVTVLSIQELSPDTQINPIDQLVL